MTISFDSTNPPSNPPSEKPPSTPRHTSLVHKFPGEKVSFSNGTNSNVLEQVKIKLKAQEQESKKPNKSSKIRMIGSQTLKTTQTKLSPSRPPNSPNTPKKNHSKQ